MKELVFAARLLFVLVSALLVPATLPAGGGEFAPPEICRKKVNTSPLILFNTCSIHASPAAAAPVLRKLKVGTPIHVLRTWKNAKGEYWFQVKIASMSAVDLASNVRRGWLLG